MNVRSSMEQLVSLVLNRSNSPRSHWIHYVQLARQAAYCPCLSACASATDDHCCPRAVLLMSQSDPQDSRVLAFRVFGYLVFLRVGARTKIDAFGVLETG
jgi:hypothetical protein